MARLEIVGEAYCSGCGDILCEGTVAWGSSVPPYSGDPSVVLCRDCIAEASEAFQCIADNCTNEGRYNSGYCGICDIQHNGGKGEKLNGA